MIHSQYMFYYVYGFIRSVISISYFLHWKADKVPSEIERLPPISSLVYTVCHTQYESNLRTLNEFYKKNTIITLLQLLHTVPDDSKVLRLKSLFRVFRCGINKVIKTCEKRRKRLQKSISSTWIIEKASPERWKIHRNANKTLAHPITHAIHAIQTQCV